MSTSPAAARPSRAGRLWQTALVAAGVGVGAYVVVGDRQQLGRAVEALSDVRAPWVLAAVAVEVLCYVCLGGTLSRLLRGTPGVGVATVIGVTAQGAANCLPGGSAVQGVVTYRQLRRRRCLPGPSASAVLLLNLLQAAALAVLAIAAEQLTSGAEPIPGLRALSGVVLAAVLGLVLVALTWRGRGLDAKWRALVDRIARLSAPAGRWLHSLTAGSLPGRDLALAAALSLAFWLADAACLACALAAVGVRVPWGGLLVTYAAGQVATLLPFTPGGLGVVEGSLAVGLVAYGLAPDPTLTAVLLYRLVSFWGLLPTAALGWVFLWRRPVRQQAAEGSEVSEGSKLTERPR